ncbi:MAG: SH3 domain-containing protein, partial [Treponema sp.]|nr:SH3 domain-containing protein [Treponema sp.]
IPAEYREKGSNVDKFEIPLAKLELAGSKKRAQERAVEFAPFALSYAETLQDRLPIREFPENGARTVYRLRLGEIIKIIAPVTGVAAVGTTGDPLPGEWFRVLTEDGTTGYCFSYRLRIFDHGGGSLIATGAVENVVDDPELDRLLSRIWSAEDYGTMVNTQRIDLSDLRQYWGFDPGQDTGIAVIKTREVERSFSYTAIRSTGTRSWRFDGSSLQMSLRSDTVLAVQYIEENGFPRTFLFVALQTSVNDLIIQELARRDALFSIIYDQGPVFTSYNYGTIVFSEDGRFSWSGNDLLIPSVIPASALGSGVLEMRLFLSPSLSAYNGAFTLRFSRLSGGEAEVNFMYTLDNQGFRLEYVPYTSLDGTVVSRRATSPLVLYFYKAEPQAIAPPEYSPMTDFSPMFPQTEEAENDFADNDID